MGRSRRLQRVRLSQMKVRVPLAFQSSVYLMSFHDSTPHRLPLFERRGPTTITSRLPLITTHTNRYTHVHPNPHTSPPPLHRRPERLLAPRPWDLSHQPCGLPDFQCRARRGIQRPRGDTGGMVSRLNCVSINRCRTRHRCLEQEEREEVEAYCAHRAPTPRHRDEGMRRMGVVVAYTRRREGEVGVAWGEARNWHIDKRSVASLI